MTKNLAQIRAIIRMRDAEESSQKAEGPSTAPTPPPAPLDETLATLKAELEKLNVKAGELRTERTELQQLAKKTKYSDADREKHNCKGISNSDMRARFFTRDGAAKQELESVKKQLRDIRTAIADVEAKQELAKDGGSDDLAEYVKIIEERDLCYVEQDHAYWSYDTDTSMWVLLNEKDLSRRYMRLRNPENMDRLNDVLQKLKRWYISKGSSFTQLPASQLNRMRKGDWLLENPLPTQHQKWFDYALHAVCGGKQENIDHVMQVIGWKYLHPETYQLPMLCLYGTGNSGKNLLAGTILSKIFRGGHKKHNLGALERFNSPLEGNVVAWFDECPDHDGEMWLRRHLANEFIAIEPKGLSPYMVHNTPLYVSTSNPVPIRVQDDGSERRYSLIKAVEPLHTVVMAGEKVNVTRAFELIDWADAHVWRDDAELGHFLFRCCEMARALRRYPPALHGEDFNEVVGNQSDAFHEVAAEVFNDPNFKYITGDGLYTLYKERAKVVNPGANPMSKMRMWERIDSWLSKNAPHAKRAKERVNITFNAERVRRKDQVIVNTELYAPDNVPTLEDNIHYYLGGRHRLLTQPTPKMAKLIDAFSAPHLRDANN